MKKNLVGLLIPLLVLMTLVACGSGTETADVGSPTVRPADPNNPDPTPPPTEPGGGADVAAPPALLRSDVERVTAPSSAAVADLVVGTNGFGLDLYRVATADNADNFVFSPLSAAQAFALLRAGATDEMAEQLDVVFGYPEGVHEANNALGLALESVNREPVREGDGEVVLEVANSVWGQAGYTFLQDYLDTLAQHYEAGLQVVDFATEGEAARQAINTWAADKTRGRISEPLKEPMNPDTVLTLVNAVYLKAGWANPFAEHLTEDRPFTLVDGTQVQAPTMAAQAPYAHVVNDDYEAVVLPYSGGELSMVVIEPADLAAFEAQLDHTLLANVVDAAQFGEVALTLPKWDFQTGTELLEPLTELGLTERRGLAGIADDPRLKLDVAFQIANITVDEDGTEAAAVTVVGVATTSLPIEPPVVVPIDIDNPFLFAIRHNDTGAILFLGRVMDPIA